MGFVLISLQCAVEIITDYRLSHFPLIGWKYIKRIHAGRYIVLNKNYYFTTQFI